MAKAAVISLTRYRFQCAVKFICTASFPGTPQTTGAFLPGEKPTAVNIHHPQTIKVKMRNKLTSSICISSYINGRLDSDAVERITCAQNKDFGRTIINGFEGFPANESTAVSSIDLEQLKKGKYKITI